MNIQSLRSGFWARGKRTGLGALAVACALIGAVAVGCGGSGGGGGSSTKTGSASLTITWPERTRLIPAASNSITASFYRAGTLVSTKTVARPTSGNTSTVSFTDLPATNLTLTASAYPNEDGTGTAQASATTQVAVEADETKSVSLTMASTINTISITPSTATIAIGTTQALTATAYDTSDATVLMSTSATTWTSSSETVATVDANGVVTALAVGTTNITFTDTESGKTATAVIKVGTVGGGDDTLVDLANAYINSLTTAQKAATVVSSNATNAAKWSNLPAVPASDGTTTLRSGVAYSSLTTAQKTAWVNFVQAALGSTGYERLNQIRRADDYLKTLNSGYSGDYVYLAFLGTPSTTGNWMFQVGGHHIANNYYYAGTTLQTTTPYFLGVEPQTFTSSGTSYSPLAAQKSGMFNLINGLSSTQLNSAKLSSSFSDVYLGPGKDARSNFPTGTTGRGLLASNLSDSQKTLLKTAIQAWTQDSKRATEYQALYESELDQTYVAYSGTTGFTNQGDYVRIDGPHVWIEFVCQNGVVQSGIHFHTVWRDRVTDYNAAYGF